MRGTWDFWIDRGGTFTDIIGRDPDGATASAQAALGESGGLSRRRHPGHPRAARLSRPARRSRPALIGDIKMGTTVATNALLERKGDRVLLLITKGFRDALRIAYQARPDIFAKEIILPEQLYERVIEVDERVRADGTVETPLDLAAIRAGDRSRPRRTASTPSPSSSCMPGNFPRTSRRSAALCRRDRLRAGLGQPRGLAAGQAGRPRRHDGGRRLSLADPVALCAGRWRRSLGHDARPFADGDARTMSPRLMFMMSSGGLTAADMFQGKDALLSGPAGGVVGMVETARLAGFDKVIGFDMGGTSTDVAHYDGDYERAFDTEVAGVRVRAPMMRIHTVAAGGGSILHFEAGRFRAGPDSAGANPGPACYRRGGPLAVTDANVMLGKLQPDFFPAIFGPGQDQPLDTDVVREKFAALAAEIGDGRTPEAVAEGFVTIAVENMANAIKKISVQRGYDVTEYLLNCFGGAGGQHACLVADALGMEAVLIHPFSGLLSAYGIGLSSVFASRQQALLQPLAERLSRSDATP